MPQGRTLKIYIYFAVVVFSLLSDQYNKACVVEEDKSFQMYTKALF